MWFKNKLFFLDDWHPFPPCEKEKRRGFFKTNYAKKIVYFILIFSISFSTFSQDKKGTGPKEKSVSGQRKIEKALRKEAREKRRKERAERKAIKAYHKRLQTKKVRKRMKSSKRTAILHNENRREPFYKRMFKKKKKT